MSLAQAYMLDTNVFNDVLDGKISVEAFVGHRIFVTKIQMAELRATKKLTRQADLLGTFEEVRPIVLPASSFVLDIEGAGLDDAEWNDGSGTFEKMLNRLRQLDKESKKKSKVPLNQERDILIAETAIKKDAVLVSADENLRKVVLEYHGRAITLIEFENEATPLEPSPS